MEKRLLFDQCPLDVTLSVVPDLAEQHEMAAVEQAEFEGIDLALEGTDADLRLPPHFAFVFFSGKRCLRFGQGTALFARAAFIGKRSRLRSRLQGSGGLPLVAVIQLQILNPAELARELLFLLLGPPACCRIESVKSGLGRCLFC